MFKSLSPKSELNSKNRKLTFFQKSPLIPNNGRKSINNVISNFANNIVNNLQKQKSGLNYRQSLSSDITNLFIDSSTNKKDLFPKKEKRIVSLKKHNKKIKTKRTQTTNNQGVTNNSNTNKPFKSREKVINNMLHQRDLLMSSLHATKDPQSILIVNKRLTKMNNKIQDLLNEDSKKILQEQWGFINTDIKEIDTSSSRLNIYNPTENDENEKKKTSVKKNKYKYISSLNDQHLNKEDILGLTKENLELYKRNKKSDIVNKLENQIKLNKLKDQMDEKLFINPDDERKDLVFIRDLDPRVNVYIPTLNHKTTYETLNVKSLRNIGFKKDNKNSFLQINQKSKNIGKMKNSQNQNEKILINSENGIDVEDIQFDYNENIKTRYSITKKKQKDLVFSKLAYEEDRENILDLSNSPRKIKNQLMNIGKLGLKNLINKKEEKERLILNKKKLQKEKNLFVESKKKDFYGIEKENEKETEIKDFFETAIPKLDEKTSPSKPRIKTSNGVRSGVLLGMFDSFEDKHKQKESEFRNKLNIFRKIFGVAYKESKRLDVKNY